MKHRFGFTVVEIVIALVIIAVGFLPIYNLFRQSSSGTMNTVHETIATNYASDLINFCKDLNLNALYEANNDKEIKFDNDTEIEKFFREKLNLISPAKVKEPFDRKLFLKRYTKYTDNGFFPAIIEFVKDALSGRKYVKSYKVEVTVTFPKNNTGANSKARDDVTLYSIIME